MKKGCVMKKESSKLYTEDEYKKVKELWEVFKCDIKYKNRFFSDNSVIKILNKLKTTKDTDRRPGDNIMVGLNGRLELYRARIGDFKNRDDKEMLGPPKEIVKQGRCNAEGVVYIYSANNYETAIYEVKPSKEEIVTVATLSTDSKYLFSFETQSKIKNFLNISPIKDSELEALVDIINDDLSTVVTNDNKLEYIPFQFITEYVKKRGFDGFLFKSSLVNGINYVLFNYEDVIVEEKKLYIIEDVKYDIKDI